MHDRAARDRPPVPSRPAAQVLRSEPALGAVPCRAVPFDFGAVPLEYEAAPSAVAGVVRSAGTPLDPALRDAAERRFGTPFGSVRVHDDAAAAATVEAVGARAWTVGTHVALGPRSPAPQTGARARLLLHELAHAVQQRATHLPPASEPVRLGAHGDPFERDARRTRPALAAAPGTAAWLQRDPPAVEVELEPASPADAAALRARGIQLPAVGAATWSAIGGSPYATLLPGYSQLGDTCGAASLVTALFVWDREHWSPQAPNARVVDACDQILIALIRYRTAAIRRWTQSPSPPVARAHPGDPAGVESAYAALHAQLAGEVRSIRAAAAQPGARVEQADYQILGQTLYFLWHSGGRGGLSSTDIEQLQGVVGLQAQGPAASGNIQSFDEIFTSAVLTGLAPDRFAQVLWIVTTGQQHAVLTGRLASGEWFWSDQGTSPASEFRAPSLPELGATVRAAASVLNYWIYTGTHMEYIRRTGNIPSWTGVKLLAPESAVDQRMRGLIAPGAFLGEVDAGATTIGSRITCGAFVARHGSLADAQAAFSAAGGGGTIVEMPQGVFMLYTTSAVSAANLGETALDAGDSSGGVLADHRFFHAWLRLGTGDGRQGAWFSLY